MKIAVEHQLYIEFAIGCAYRVLPKFESKYPDDARPRNALVTAWNFLVKPSKKTKADAVYADANAAYAADAAANAAYAADAAASASASAAAANAAYAADAAASASADAGELSWQAGFLALLNVKYKLSIKIRGVQ